ncbi:SusD/RagB family nutrient-binding outer membrane lipoprotein [Chitinophaga vietnamensis]|uniref:SusD/RagB family nutrient-binding outer membrane lipoprotein n=1 Tax=Chitinophaga vietnamensis TaxID=2593957 RepID=UPI0011776188|nr:SusD/RagB family nutrient-binding outer membrane lipoprotein [Chitinophaga vietnamensis]
MKRLSYIFLGALVVMTACTKNFLDINTDPNNPTKVSLVQLLPSTEQGLAYALGFSNSGRGAIGLTEVLAVYMHQVTVRESQDQYGANGSQFDINGSWSQFYSSQGATSSSDIIGTMENLNVLIRLAEQQDNRIYAGIGKVLKAYGVSQFVDAFADVPFSQANQYATSGVRYPKFDKGQDIYPQLFAMLDSAIADLTNTTSRNALKPGSDDVFYGGSVTQWVKCANSIKLKLYNQVRLVQDVSANVTALVNGGKLFSKTTDGFMMKYGSGVAPDDRNPGFSEYYATQKTHYQSPWFYEILRGYNPKIFTGIKDPRIPYYFFNQNSATGAAQNGTDYRDSAFISILFGSVGPNRDKSQDNSLTVFGMYPVGGRYDDGNPQVVKSTSGTGAAPLRLLTYADVLYIEAELMNAGVLAGDPRSKLKAAMQESFATVDYVVSLAKGGQSVPTLVGASSADYINKILAVYDARITTADKLEVIMTEKWIQSFGFSCDQYTDYRRTGYPVLFNPNDPSQAPGGFFQPPLAGDPSIPGPQAKVKVVLGRKYPLSLPWPTNELNVNPNAPAQKQPDATPVFWRK